MKRAAGFFLCFCLLRAAPASAAELSARWGPAIGAALPVEAPGAVGRVAGNLSFIGDFSSRDSLRVLAPLAEQLERLKLGETPVSAERFERLGDKEKKELLSRAIEAQSVVISERANALIDDNAREIDDPERIKANARAARQILDYSYYFLTEVESLERLWNAQAAFERQARQRKNLEVVSNARLEARAFLRENPSWKELEILDLRPALREHANRQELTAAKNIAGAIKLTVATEGILGRQAYEQLAGAWEGLLNKLEALLEAPAQLNEEVMESLLEQAIPPVASFRLVTRADTRLTDSVRAARLKAAKDLLGLLKGLRARVK